MSADAPASGGAVPHASLFWGTSAAVVLGDAFTKMLAVDRLVATHRPHEVVGDWVRLTLVYNPGAAFGLHLGPYSRWIFTGLTLVALAVLGSLWRGTRPGDTVRVLALALVSGGAVGNLLDRLRSPRGVVDFIDVGVDTLRWPTFNVADIAVSTGACILALVLWREDADARPESAPVSDPA